MTNVLNRLTEIKFNNKKKLAEYIKETTGIEVNPNSIFDVQVKRLHEYKRQLLNILHIMDLYNKLKENPLLDIEPRTFIFGAKAAAGYRRAKGIIKLINAVAEKVNNDTDINDKIKVVFLETTEFHLQKNIPCGRCFRADFYSRKEASGTGI